MTAQLAIALYRPHQGQDDSLRELIDRHLPTLRSLELVTDKPATLARSQDGTYVEIFEWRSHGAKEAAHQHPSVAAIWEAMAEIADLLPLASLAEAQAPFPNFSVLSTGDAQA